MRLEKVFLYFLSCPGAQRGRLSPRDDPRDDGVPPAALQAGGHGEGLEHGGGSCPGSRGETGPPSDPFLTPSLPQLPGEGTKRGGEGSTRSASSKRRREEEDEKVQRVRDIVEVFPVDGVCGKVVRYLNDQTGEIVVADTRKGNYEVIFNQVQGTLFSLV